MSIDVLKWLSDLELDQYAGVFAENDIDARVLPLLSGDDLKELGVSLGHRKIILAAIQDLIGENQAASSPSGEQRSENPQSPPSGEGQSTRKKTAPAIAERRHVTVLFADLVGSTELINRYDPEDMRSLLQSYQDAVAGAVSRFGGYVAKFLGDGLLVFFGWPQAYEDHAIRAIKAGAEAVLRVRDLKTPSGERLSVRLGIASGDVVVGDTIGENTYEEAAMTGPVVNLAARIQEHAPPNSVVVSLEDSEPSLHRIFEFTSLGKTHLKGFPEPRTLMKVVMERTAESRFQAAHSDDTDSAMIGRDDEKGFLLQSWQRAQNGHGEVVLLAGEAGIGKSRLTEEFLAELTKQDQADIIRLNCSSYLSSSPFHPVTQRISQDAGVEPDFDDHLILEHVRTMLEGRPGLDWEQVLPAFAALVAPRSEPARKVLEMSPQEQRDTTIQTLIHTVEVRSRVCPVLLCVEDAHWIDPSTQALLERFKAVCSDLPLMILITHRPGWQLARDDGDAHVQSLVLRRFDAAHVANLVENITGKKPDDALISMIVEKTDGVPLFVEEMTRAILDAGEAGQVHIPSSLKGALMARLDAVSPEAKQIALTGSVIGREFEPGILAAAKGLERSGIDKSLEELLRTGLIFESGQNRGHFVFRHALIRDTAYQSMLNSTRKQQHADVAWALMQKRSAEIERRPELVARHLSEAEDWKAAFEKWQLATEMALARSASHEAMTNAKETLRAAEGLGPDSKGEVVKGKILVGRSHDSLGQLPEGIAVLKEASNAALTMHDVELAADAANHFADSCMMSSERHGEAIELCRNALKDLPDDDEVRRCRLMSQLARAHMFVGQFSDGARFGQQSMELAAKLGDYKSQFSVMMMHYGAPFVARKGRDAQNWRENLEAMHGVAEHLGSIDQGRNRTLSLFVGAEMADRALMDHSLELLTEISEKDNHLQLYWVQKHARAMVAIMDGDFDKAETHATEAVKIGRKTHGAHVEGVFGVQMFTIRREQNRLHEVAPVIKKLMTDSPEDISWKPGFGLIAAELGYKDPAERILNEMAENGFDLPLDAMYSTTLSYLADICSVIEHRDHAKTLFNILAPYEDLTITAGATTVCAGAAARRLGNLAAVLKDWDAAEAMFQKAIDIDTSMRCPPWIAHSKAAYAAALRRRGRPQDIQHAFQLEGEALAISQKLSMVSLRSKLEGVAS